MKRSVHEIALRVPKVELHVHLDGSLSASFIKQRCAKLGLAFPVQESGDEAEEHRELCKWIFDMKANPHKMKPFLPPTTEQVGMMGLFDWMNQVCVCAGVLCVSFTPPLAMCAFDWRHACVWPAASVTGEVT